MILIKGYCYSCYRVQLYCKLTEEFHGTGDDYWMKPYEH